MHVFCFSSVFACLLTSVRCPVLFLLNMTCVALVLNLGLHEIFLWVVVSVLFGVQAVQVVMSTLYFVSRLLLHVFTKSCAWCRHNNSQYQRIP